MRLKPTRLRWFSQIVFFSLFLFLLLRTEFRGSLHAGGSEIRLPYPVQLFFQFDPLVTLSNALSSRALYHGLLWSLVVLIPTMLLGRFFCGWICPLGSIHHFFSSLRSERKRGKQLIESNRYKRWQTTKYYLLVAALIAAVLGTGIVGWLDPFSLLVRSVGLSILPGTNYALNAVLHAMEHSRFAPVQGAGSGLHFVFGWLLLGFKQPYFRQGIWLGLIFIFFLALMMHHEFRRLECVVLNVAPRCVADGSVGLPILRTNARELAAFDVEHSRLFLHGVIFVVDHAHRRPALERFVVIERREASEIFAHGRLADPPIKINDVRVILLDNLSGAGQPVVGPGLGNESEIIGQRSVLFGFDPAMRGSVKGGVLRIIEVRDSRAPDSQEEIMFHAVGRGTQMQAFGSNGLGEIAQRSRRGPIFTAVQSERPQSYMAKPS